MYFSHFCDPCVNGISRTETPFLKLLLRENALDIILVSTMIAKLDTAEQ